MKIDFPKPFWQVIGLGAISGMRSSFGPMVASHILSSNHSEKLEHSPLNFMQKETTASVLKVAALGELIADKFTSGDRIAAAGVAGRMVSGGLAGASIYEAANEKTAHGYLLGAAAAIAATYASFYLRKGVVEKSKIFDPIIGAIEDAVVICAGIHLIKQAIKNTPAQNTWLGKPR